MLSQNILFLVSICAESTSGKFQHVTVMIQGCNYSSLLRNSCIGGPGGRLAKNNYLKFLCAQRMYLEISRSILVKVPCEILHAPSAIFSVMHERERTRLYCSRIFSFCHSQRFELGSNFCGPTGVLLSK